jgi:hypothetical protein
MILEINKSHDFFFVSLTWKKGGGEQWTTPRGRRAYWETLDADIHKLTVAWL